MAKRRRMVDTLGGYQPSPTARQRARGKATLSSRMSSDESLSRSLRRLSDEMSCERLHSDAHTAVTSIPSSDANTETDEDELEQQQHMQEHILQDAEPGEQLGQREERSSGEFETVSLYPDTFHDRRSFHRESTPRAEDSSGRDYLASTRSLWAQDLDYRDIHGRRYCRDYYMPNDEMEQLRLALLHQVFLHVLGGKLTTVPLEDPTRILDIGTGTGDWAMKMGEHYPRCEIVGTDISAIAETSAVPMNVFFEIEDAEDWDRPSDFYDFIHLRNMEGAFKDWGYLYENICFSLKPGGWIEVLNFDSPEACACYIPHLPPDSPINELLDDTAEAMRKRGYLWGTAHMDPMLLINAGFVDVRVIEYMIPISTADQTTGKIWLITCLDAFEATSLRILTEEMGWDPDRCKALCEKVAREMAVIAKDEERNKGLYVNLRIATGRKPVKQEKDQDGKESLDSTAGGDALSGLGPEGLMSSDEA